MTTKLTPLLFMLFSVLFLSPTIARKKSHASLLQEIRNKDLKDSIPKGDSDDPLKVEFSMFLLNVAEADPVKKEVTIEAWLALKWNSGITWDVNKFNGHKAISVPTSYMWIPDISVFNGLNELSNSAPDMVMVTHSGEVLWVPRVSLRVLCDFDANKMAWNVSCNYRFGFWTTSDEFLNITIQEEQGTDLSQYFEGSRFEILGISAKRNSMNYPCCPGGVYSFYDIGISFKEKNPSHTTRGCVQNILTWH